MYYITMIFRDYILMLRLQQIIWYI